MPEQSPYFEEIYQANYQRVIRICMGYVKGDETLAKDLAQEVFIKVWENLTSFRNESSIATWIYRITVNTCLLQLRNRKFSSDLKALETINEEGVDTAPKESQLKQMYACIGKLNEDNKAIIILVLEGLAQQEIAEIMGISHEAVRVRIHRIKNSLTKCVKNG